MQGEQYASTKSLEKYFNFFSNDPHGRRSRDDHGNLNFKFYEFEVK